MTTPATAKKPMTADEFWEFVHRPEDENKRFELIRGEVVEGSRPTKAHGVLQLRIGSHLERWVEQVARGYVAVEAGLVLAEDPASVVGPDVAYYTDANTFDDLHPKWGDVPPVLAVEVLSPNDKLSHVNRRVREYLLGGVKVVWVVDYELREVRVYRPDRTLDVTGEAGELTGGDDLPGLVIRVADIFRFPGQTPNAPPQPPTA